MKLTVAGSDSIVIDCYEDEDGDIAVTANGIDLLWIMDDGRVCCNRHNPKELEKLGFQIGDNNQVVVTE